VQIDGKDCPAVVLNEVMADVKDIKSVFVVTEDAAGDVRVSSSWMSLEKMCFLTEVLNRRLRIKMDEASEPA
jgi:hypothetical protein